MNIKTYEHKDPEKTKAFLKEFSEAMVEGLNQSVLENQPPSQPRKRRFYEVVLIKIKNLFK